MPGKAQNSGFEDAATRKPCLESPHEPRQRQNQLAVQSQSRAPEVWLSMQIFQVVEDLGADLRAQGADAAILVMLGGVGAGTNSGFWSRVVMLESNGVWLMELLHGLTGFKDLYSFNND